MNNFNQNNDPSFEYLLNHAAPETQERTRLSELHTFTRMVRSLDDEFEAIRVDISNSYRKPSKYANPQRSRNRIKTKYPQPKLIYSSKRV